MMKINYIKLMLVMFFLISSLCAQEEKKRVLYLNSYHQDMTWVKDMTKGIYEILDIEKNNFTLHIENMDTQRYNSKEYYDSLATLYQNKYQHTQFDLILASDNNAFNFLKKYRDRIFGDVPVSFSGVNNYEDSMIDGYNNYTGVAEISSEKETVALILKIHPKVKSIYIINDYLKTGRAWQKKLEKNLAIFTDKINIIYNTNQSLSELQNHIKNLPPDCIVLMGVYFADNKNKYITYKKMGSYLLDISPVPVYALTNFTISDGVVGGKVLSGYEHGKMMSKLGFSILQGMDANKIDVVKDGVNPYIFNDIALKKFNINTDLLPEKYELLNKNEDIVDKYGMVTGVVLIILSSIVIFIILLLYEKGIKDEKSILKILVYGPIVFIPTVIIILIYSIISNNQDIHKNDVKKLQATYLAQQKTFTINKVEKVSEHVYKLKNKKAAITYINNSQYGETDYLFALDSKGNVLAHGTIPEAIGTNMINLVDSNGVELTRNIIKNAMGNSFELTEYLWYNAKLERDEKKYTYSKYIPQYDMIIASGVYNQNVQNIIKEKTIELNNRNKLQIQNMITISIIVIILSIVLSVLFSNIIKKIFEQYNDVIDTKNSNLEQLNNSLEDKIQEEVKKSHDKDSVIFQQSKMAAMGDMIGNIAHQWRQPLSIISTAATGMIVKIEFKMLQENEVKKNCELINNNVQFLSQTIDDFKNYIKNDREMSMFNLKSTIENLLSLVHSSLKTHQIKVILDLEEDINLNGYPNELIQCMINIVNNAKDALITLDGEKYIFISTKQNQQNVQIIFRDNAQGIPPKIIEKIFEPYFSTKHKSQGTGLGLSMTYNIITQGMFGYIDVKNSTYQYNNIEYTGAEFSITLPFLSLDLQENKEVLESN